MPEHCWGEVMLLIEFVFTAVFLPQFFAELYRLSMSLLIHDLNLGRLKYI